jgi:putative membrane protein
MRLLAKWLVVALVLAVAPQLIDGIHVAGFGTAVGAAALYGILFLLVGWLVAAVVGLLSIVPGILTLGLFFFLVPLLVHTVLLKWTAGLMDSFTITSWGDAFLLSLLLAVVSLIFDGDQRSRERQAR